MYPANPNTWSGNLASHKRYTEETKEPTSRKERGILGITCEGGSEQHRLGNREKLEIFKSRFRIRNDVTYYL